jgi:hypothetical protein
MGRPSMCAAGCAGCGVACRRAATGAAPHPAAPTSASSAAARGAGVHYQEVTAADGTGRVYYARPVSRAPRPSTITQCLTWEA